MPFVFRLASVLGHRKRVEEEKQVALAAAQATLLAEVTALRRLEDEQAASEETLRTNHAGLDADTLRFTYAHLEYLARAIEGRKQRVASAEYFVGIARSDVIAAARDTKVLDTLRTRQREAYDAHEALVEQRELDDANARRAAYNHSVRTPS